MLRMLFYLTRSQLNLGVMWRPVPSSFRYGASRCFDVPGVRLRDASRPLQQVWAARRLFRSRGHCAPFEASDWTSLVGTYCLTTVQTSQGGSPIVWCESLSLQTTDSATRFARRSSLNSRSERGDRPLIGTAKADAPDDRPTPAEY